MRSLRFLLRSCWANAVYRAAKHRNRLLLRPIWPQLQGRLTRCASPISTRIHGHPVVINANYTYPLYSRIFPTLNNPLVELVHQVWKIRQGPLRIIDVGAAVGDTALLVRANCPDAWGEFICIDADPEFLPQLRHNIAQLPSCRAIGVQLSRCRRAERSLVRTHAGTASAQGGGSSDAQPLDDVIAANGIAEPVDLLKTDVDGFDGEVLAGATRLLSTSQPAVIFEWHPKLCAQTGTDAFLAFETLRANGYSRLLWFTKFGTFSHYCASDDGNAIRRLHRHCLHTTTDGDWHYDVVALHDDSDVDEQGLADLRFAVGKRSPW